MGRAGAIRRVSTSKRRRRKRGKLAYNLIEKQGGKLKFKTHFQLRIMSTDLLVAAVLALGWSGTLFLIAILSNRGLLPGRSFRRLMRRSRDEVEAEIGAAELDVRTRPEQRFSSDGTASEYVDSEVQGTSHRTSVDTPYAEASVMVLTPGGKEKRRCSVYLN